MYSADNLEALIVRYTQAITGRNHAEIRAMANEVQRVANVLRYANQGRLDRLHVLAEWAILEE